MSSLVAQRDHLATLKKKTRLNASILSKIYPMSSLLANQIFQNNALEKPTQLFFIHLSYYFVCIIDPQKAALFTWPLYDSKSERTYRNEFSSFIADYCKLGVLSPVISSYFVNPGCFKVTKLMLQLSELAVEQALQKKNKDCKEVQEKFKSKSNDFFEYVEKETRKVRGRFVKYQQKKKMYELLSQPLKNKIAENEEKNKSLKKVLQSLVHNFINKHNLEGQIKAEIEAIKNINQPVTILDSILQNHDDEISNMEVKWNESQYLEMLQRCQLNAEALILRHTGESDKKSYMIEYNPKTDDLETKDLEAQVNSQQKYILKNVIVNVRLNFPNLIRSFVISMCFILKNVEFDYDIQQFNECLEVNHRNYSEVLMAFRILMERVLNAESKLPITKPNKASSSSSQMMHHGYDQSILPSREMMVIPPLPDLTDLKFNSMDSQIHFNSVTPLNLSKLQFNLRRKTSVPTFAKPQARSLITPFHQAPRDHFLQTMISSRISSYERPKLNMSQNLSIISQGTNRGNETIASGFTQQQIQRLLSTRKTSSSKKYKFNTKRNNTDLQRGLFNESTESTHMFRSHSSPNLFEDREKRSISRSHGRQLSIMQEDSPCSLLEVSGIALLESNSRCGTPQRINLESYRKLLDATSLPTIAISPVEALESKFNHTLKETEDFSRLSRERSPQQLLKDNSKCSSSTESLLIREESTETPKTALHPIRKTSSIEKIINRFKKVRANCKQDVKEDKKIEIRIIPEEKENNFNAVNTSVFTATNRILLPDLLSPSSVLPSKKVSRSDNLEELCLEMDNKDRRKPRESLGAALGVDQTFLDQFDLID